MPKLKEIKQYDINNFSFSKGNAFSKNDKASEEETTKAVNFMKGMMAWYQNVKKHLKFDDEEFMDSLDGDDLNPNQTNDQLKKEHDNLDFDPKKVTKDTAKLAWQLDSPRLLKGVGSLLSRGVMTDSFISDKTSSLDKKAAYYIKVVEPMMSNDGKLFKEVLKGYANLEKKSGADLTKVENTINSLYKAQKNFIDTHLKNKPELQAKIQELKNDFNKLEEASGGQKSIVRDEPKALQEEHKVKAYSRLDQYKDQLYSDKKIDTNDHRLAKKARELFRSTRVVALGSESTEHSFLNQAVKAYDKYDNNDDVLGFAVDSLSEETSKKVFMLNNIKHYATSYAQIKTKNGLPSTPAGKDRLTGAFALIDNADKELASIEADIVKDGKYKNLKEYMNSKEYMTTALEEVNKQIAGIEKFNKGDRVREAEEEILLAQQAAYNIKLNPDKYKEFEQYKDMPASHIAERLAADKSFITACEKTLADKKRSGVEMSVAGEDLLKGFKAIKFNEGPEIDAAVTNNKVKKTMGKGPLGF